MALQHLTEEQIQTWTREQKDRWWLTNVYRGNMPQLTLRSALTGFLLGGVLSATNLYIGAKTGWSLGVGLTSVILAFAMFKVMASMRMAKDFTILENNAMQSIATAAGYMTGPLISGLAAYMMVQNYVMPWHQMLISNVVLSILGVLVAFPMKRRFINEEQAPFPEGRACGVVLDTLYTSDAGIGMFKAKVLIFAGLFAGFLKFIAGEGYMKYLQIKVLGFKAAAVMPEHLDAWYYALVEKGKAAVPTLKGIDIRNLGLSPTLDLAMFGAGGLMHIRYALNMFLGLVFSYAIVAPWAIASGWVQKNQVVLQVTDKFSYRDVLLGWLLWPGVALIVTASLAGFLAKPQVILSAFRGLGKKKDASEDPLRDIELPLWVSFVGIPIVGALGVYLTHRWFGVDYVYGALAILLTMLLTVIAANSTALTSITPTGAMSKITQFTFGTLDPGHAGTNLMTATMTTEVASNASNLLMDIKPGYMLGAKPRQQAIGHIIGIFAGGLASTPLFYVLFLAGHKDNPLTSVKPEYAGDNIQTFLTRGEFGFPGALQWKGVSDFVTGLSSDAGLGAIMHPSALTAMAIAAVVGIVFELLRTFTKNKTQFAPLALGLGFVLPPDSTFWMFLGAFFFWICSRLFAKAEGKLTKRLFIDSLEPICAGLIAGASLVGIGDILIQTFLL
jgi:OPT family oligopeptide transporter